MVVEYVRYRIPEDRRAAFEDAYRAAGRSLRASPHCLRYELAHGVEEPDNYVLRIEWDSVEGHESGFRASPEFAEFFAAVKPFFADIAEMKHYAVTDVAGERPTIYEFAGGAPAFRELTEVFYAKVLADPLLAPVFEHFTPEHVTKVAVWLGEVFGGPADYSTGHGGHRDVLTRHLGLAITEEQRIRWVELMMASARQVLPANDVLRRRFGEYIEWGTAIARDVSQPGGDIGDPGPVPQWSWE
ncbi:MAG TPA: antibiotic biosynthesis monooxygenase [Pseudonocardiaceae bacterium]|nr:antibiotic biosynthesis monooxygenase [Pseudonocardiaceae bacterium]